MRQRDLSGKRKSLYTVAMPAIVYLKPSPTLPER